MVAHLPISFWPNVDAFSKLLGESYWMILPSRCFVGTAGLNTSSSFLGRCKSSCIPYYQIVACY